MVGHSVSPTATERRDSEPTQLIYLWISDGFWIITILPPGRSIGNYSKSCLWFSTCPLTIINMQSTQGHTQGKNHKMKPFSISCPPLPCPPLSWLVLSHPFLYLSSCIISGTLTSAIWVFCFWQGFLNWDTRRPPGLKAQLWFSTLKIFVSLPGHLKICREDQWDAGFEFPFRHCTDCSGVIFTSWADTEAGNLIRLNSRWVSKVHANGPRKLFLVSLLPTCGTSFLNTYSLLKQSTHLNQGLKLCLLWLSNKLNT